jgi:hypothetical protein
MHKLLFTIYLFAFCELIAFGQKITLKDLNSFANKTTDEVAEGLLNRGFELHSYPNGKEFQITQGDESLSIDFKDNNPYYTYKLVQLCYSASFNRDYENLVSQIKLKGKKLSFFYSDYSIYMTEYKIGDNFFVYVCKGICESLDRKTKFGSLLISDERIQQKLKR